MAARLWNLKVMEGDICESVQISKCHPGDLTKLKRRGERI